MKVTSFRKKLPLGRHGEAPWGGLGRILRNDWYLWAPHWPLIPSLFQQKRMSGEEAKTRQILLSTVAEYAQPLRLRQTCGWHLFGRRLHTPSGQLALARRIQFAQAHIPPPCLQEKGGSQVVGRVCGRASTAVFVASWTFQKRLQEGAKGTQKAPKRGPRGVLDEPAGSFGPC